MTMVKDSLQKAYARNGKTASYNCAQADDPSMESLGENVDSKLSKQSEETAEEEPGEENLEGLPLVDKEQLEEKGEEILNKMINSHQILNRINHSDSQLNNTIINFCSNHSIRLPLNPVVCHS